MTQAILLSAVTSTNTGNPVSINAPKTVNVQITSGGGGFTGVVLIEVSLTPDVNSLWYPIVTIGERPWFHAVRLKFSNNASVLVFNMALNTGIRLMRASVIEHGRGTVSAYIAY